LYSPLQTNAYGKQRNVSQQNKYGGQIEDSSNFRGKKEYRNKNFELI